MERYLVQDFAFPPWFVLPHAARKFMQRFPLDQRNGRCGRFFVRNIGRILFIHHAELYTGWLRQLLSAQTSGNRVYELGTLAAA